MRKLVLLVIASMITLQLHAQIYVTETSSGQHNGTSWADAYTDLQTAIDAASAGDTIWVAQGTYKPSIDTLGALPTTPEQRSFWLKNNVVIYGGFNGTETSLSQRDPIHLKATLEGEITPGTFAEHVLYIYTSIDSTAILDGFILQNGKSTATSSQLNGSGVLLYGSPQFFDIEFRNNTTHNQGGAIYAESSAALFVRCRFEGNTTTMYDGAACNLVLSDIEMYNCVFENNHANRFGSAITTVQSDLLVQNGTFVGNTSAENTFQFSSGGNIHLNHCIFTADNVSPTPVGTSGASIYFLESLMPQDNSWLIMCPSCWAGTPTFVNGPAGDFSLAQGSLGIDDTLANTPNNTYTDIAGNPRAVGFSIDLGAYEYQTAVGIASPRSSQHLIAYPNPTAAFLTVQAADPIQDILIYNLAGQQIQTENTPTFSVAQLPAGIYLLQVTTTNGFASTRFIKE